ncbi:arogenate dehydratase/prephenate dehydratase 2 chloroplastic-like, partial [Trifolium medium]|nr:arogenate dehydratase/prephenate dehydratase 2 chloroplastic-like [Trifolium medium]
MRELVRRKLSTSIEALMAMPGSELYPDDSDNVTRFLVLAREPILPGIDRTFKTSIVFSLEEGPGILIKALAVFALRQINLSKVSCRLGGELQYLLWKYFDYLFYVDFEASMADQNAQNALRHLK